MTISEKDKEDLIAYRFDQAKESADTAELLIKFNKNAAAVNRIYYSAFYCLLALGLFHNFKSSKHMQLIGWFNKTFILTGIFEKEFGRILRDCYNLRISADYDSFSSFTEADIMVLYRDMKSFITLIENYINKMKNE
jgi:uncharacterized protein (UPF0332 family)